MPWKPVTTLEIEDLHPGGLVRVGNVISCYRLQLAEDWGNVFIKEEEYLHWERVSEEGVDPEGIIITMINNNLRQV